MTKRTRGWFLHALLLATAFVILAWPLALDEGLIAGAVGAIVGTLVAETLVATRYRPWVLWGTGLAFGLSGWMLARTVLASHGLASALSPTATIRLGEMLRWFAVALGACVVLRGTALRYRVALAVEGTVAVAAVVATVAAHRDGMIARPLEVSDWFWRHGLDPVVAFLAVGVGAAILLSGLLLHGRSRRRAIVQLGLVLLLAVYMASQIHGSDPASKQKDAIGKPLEKAKDDQKRQAVGGAGAGGEGRPAGAQDSDLPEPDQGGRQRPAAIVVFHRDVRPASGAFYFRRAAFSQFNGTRLVQSTLPGVDPGARNAFPTQRRPVPGVPEQAAGRTEVATDVALLTPHYLPFALIDAVELGPKPNPDPGRFIRAYSVVSKVLTMSPAAFLDLPAGNPEWDDRTWELYTELPHDERYFALATELQSRLREEYNQSPIALALTVKEYLEETTTYSFSRRYKGDEPTGDFLFSEDRKGYCVHLAHAAAYLMRALGLPARVSVGYAVDASNLGGGSALLVKGGDAHAWAELYIEGQGWLPIEVTPKKTDVEPTPFQEKDLQQLLGEMARREARDERTPSAGWPIMSWLRQVWRTVPWVLLGLIAVAYIVKVWRMAAPLVGRRPKLAYRAALDRLSAVGLVRRHGEPRERFAARLNDIAPSMTPLTAGLSGYVLGSVEPPEQRAGAPLHQLANAVGVEVRRAVPAWRWILGMLNPLSWWWSR